MTLLIPNGLVSEQTAGWLWGKDGEPTKEEPILVQIWIKGFEFMLGSTWESFSKPKRSQEPQESEDLLTFSDDSDKRRNVGVLWALGVVII